MTYLNIDTDKKPIVLARFKSVEAWLNCTNHLEALEKMLDIVEPILFKRK